MSGSVSIDRNTSVKDLNFAYYDSAFNSLSFAWKESK